MIKKYAKIQKRLVIEAIQFTGEDKNCHEIKKFCPLLRHLYYEGKIVYGLTGDVGITELKMGDYLLCEHGDVYYIMKEKQFHEHFEEVE